MKKREEERERKGEGEEEVGRKNKRAGAENGREVRGGLQRWGWV